MPPAFSHKDWRIILTRQLMQACRAAGERAVEIFKPIIPREPQFWRARYLAGLQLAAMGKIEEAAAQFMEVIRYRPDFAPAHLNLGVMLAKQGKPVRALAEFRITLQLELAARSIEYQLWTAKACNAQAATLKGWPGGSAVRSGRFAKALNILRAVCVRPP